MSNTLKASKIILTAAEAYLTIMIELQKANQLVTQAQAQGRELNDDEWAVIMQFEQSADDYYHKQLAAKKARDAGGTSQ